MPGWRATSAVSARSEAGTMASVVRSPARPRSSSRAARTTAPRSSAWAREESVMAQAPADDGLRGSGQRHGAADHARAGVVDALHQAARPGRRRHAGSRRASGRRGFPRGQGRRGDHQRHQGRIGRATALEGERLRGARSPASRPARSRTTPSVSLTRARSGRHDPEPAAAPTGRRRGQRRRTTAPAMLSATSARRHHGLEQRVAGQPVGAVQAGRGHLAAGPQASTCCGPRASTAMPPMW